MNGNSINLLVQWDDEVYIRIDEPEINQAYNVHFFNQTTDQAYVVRSEYLDGALTVKIPNALLIQPYVIYGYVFITNDDGNKSLLAFEIKIRKRPKPMDYIAKDTIDYVRLEDVIAECKDITASLEQRITAEEQTSIHITERLDTLLDSDYILTANETKNLLGIS